MIHSPSKAVGDPTNGFSYPCAAQCNRGEAARNQEGSERQDDKVGEQKIIAHLAERVHGNRQGAELCRKRNDYSAGEPTNDLSFQRVSPFFSMKFSFEILCYNDDGGCGGEGELETDVP